MANQTETDIVRLIMLKLSKAGARIFRNNTGNAWIGQSIRITKPQIISVTTGDVVVKNARYFTAGLCVGSSDLIGLKPVLITPEMVGKTVAVFTAVEVKTATGRATKEQVAFLQMVKDIGGISFIARNDVEAEEMLKYYSEHRM